MSPILKHFECNYVQESINRVGQPILGLALHMEAELPEGPEKSAGLRKLLEARECFVRAALKN